MTLGRPSIFTEELAADICGRIQHGETLTEICERDDMPSLSTVYEWLDQTGKSAFRMAYARAREGQIDRLEDAAYRRAITGNPEPVISKGKVVVDAQGNAVMVAKPSDQLAIKLLEGRKRDIYGRHTTLAGDPNKPLTIHDTSALSSMTDAEIEAEIARRT